MTLDLGLVILGGIMLAVGFIGTVVPVLPGSPFAWGGLFVSYFSSYTKISIVTLVITGIFAVLVCITDNIFPIFFTKKWGGSKAGSWGAAIGLFIGFFAGIWGILFGPFAGSLIGEMIHDTSDIKRAFKAACGSFMGFICGVGCKMIVCGAFIWIYIFSLIRK